MMHALPGRTGYGSRHGVSGAQSVTTQALNNFRKLPRQVVASSYNNGAVVQQQTTDVAHLHAELARLREENQALKAELELVRGTAGGSGKGKSGSKAGKQSTSSSAAVAGLQVMTVPSNAPSNSDLSDLAALLETGDAEAIQQHVDPSQLQQLLREGIAWPKAGEQFWQREARTQPFPVPLRDSLDVPLETDARKLHIVHIAAELAPIGKVGGLGDVVSGLSKACMERGHHVQVIMPFYECLDKDQIEDLKHEMDLEVPKGYTWDGQTLVGNMKTSVFWGRVAGLPVYFIRPADWGSSNIFKGGRIYGGSYDDREAYLYFCRASLEFLKTSGQQPHILQVHDWHTAAVAMLFWEIYHGQGLFKPRIVMTIHNLDNSGEVRQDEFFATGLPGEMFAHIDKALDERTIGHNPERLNLMKGGIVYSNAVTTVSPTYASEIRNTGTGGFLRPLFQKENVAPKFSGILNGVDAADWCPAYDTVLPANYNAQLPAGKQLCKEYLQRGLGMAVDPSKPLVAVVSRLVNQKNPGLMAAAAHHCRDRGAQFVLLGSGGQDAGLKHMAANEYRDHPDIRILIMYNERLSHLIYAAADIVLVPSNFEPCGLTQMLAMRYGALPCVRRTGGLADTVKDLDTWQGPEEERNGFTFDGTDAGSLHGALDRAFNVFKQDQPRWQATSTRNMQADVSWAKPARDYVQLYHSIAMQDY